MPTPGSRVKDVFTAVRVERRSDTIDAASILSVRYSIAQCTDEDCFASTKLKSSESGTVMIGQPVTVSVH